MKTIKRGRIPKEPWIGFVVYCDVCKGRFKLKKGDPVKEGDSSDEWNIKCPTKRCTNTIPFLAKVKI